MSQETCFVNSYEQQQPTTSVDLRPQTVTSIFQAVTRFNSRHSEQSEIRKLLTERKPPTFASSQSHHQQHHQYLRRQQQHHRQRMLQQQSQHHHLHHQQQQQQQQQRNGKKRHRSKKRFLIELKQKLGGAETFGALASCWTKRYPPIGSIIDRASIDRRRSSNGRSSCQPNPALNDLSKLIERLDSGFVRALTNVLSDEDASSAFDQSQPGSPLDVILDDLTESIDQFDYQSIMFDFDYDSSDCGSGGSGITSPVSLFNDSDMDADFDNICASPHFSMPDDDLQRVLATLEDMDPQHFQF